MKKFKFRYESVLKMRLDKEDQLKNDLAKLVQKRQNILDQIDHLKEKLEDYSSWVQEGLLSGRRMHYYEIDQGKQYYRKHIHDLTVTLQQVEAKIEEAKVVLTEAMKERKVMEKLKEKDYQKYIDDFNQADAKVIEEIVNYKNNKKDGGE
ncbi:flagellar export protein FliJ [Fusibacter ferrireducens]|uniref:Flagellar FliJ protein n=1 Tax=Fusibacter ferrireducens TaxID=2785058 RepID=A0ABR9ZP11_9FIRM|nr:flagellar export protein FliJ [Fusibacter ferrireducens]MBF4691726.1 flagellar export protein FliJ [Fusibacter ferrireducens]